MTAARIHQALYAAFGLKPPHPPPTPVDPARFPIFSRPAPPAALDPQRLAAGGTITITITIPKR